MEEKLVELLTKLEMLAPDVLRIAMRQVLVGTIKDGVLFLLLSAASVALFVGGWRAHKKDSDSIDGSIGIFCGCFCACLALMCIEPLATALLNPEWAAIKLLLGQVQ